MLRTLYRTLLPQRVRAGVYGRVAPLFEDYYREKRRVVEAARSRTLPSVEVQPRHLENAQLLTDRSELLRRLPRGAVVAEVGVNQGDFSQEILDLAQPQRLHLIDPWESERYHDGLMNKVRDRFRLQLDSGQVVLHRGYSTTELPQFEPGYFDWVYIDTTHTYDTTAQELEICRSRVKPDGIIAGHDYVTGNWESHFRYGVVEAVNEFCVRHDWQFIYLTHETHRHLSFAITPIR